MSELELYARHYYNLGLNVTCISNKINQNNFYERNILKSPNHRWDHLFYERQEIFELNSFDWDNATGAGSVTEFMNIRVIDIDGCNDLNFLDKALTILRLPKNYEWVVLSGSGNGFHIYINADKFSHLSKEEVVSTYPPKEDFKQVFDKIEFLWSTHTVLPPSLHNSGKSYRFINCNYPKSLPKGVNRGVLSLFVSLFLEGNKVETGFGYGQIMYEYKATKNLPSDLTDPDYSKFDNQVIFCVLDIETDGFLEKDGGVIRYPNVVQVAWVLMNLDGVIIKKQTELINYPDIKFTEAFEIHKIDIEVIKRIGKQPQEVYASLSRDIRLADFVVAHNIDFDITILRDQFRRYHLIDILQSKRILCTMRESVDFCGRTDFRGNLRYPKLVELYKSLFNYDVQQIHNAESDALLTAKCLKELIARGIIVINS